VEYFKSLLINVCESYSHQSPNGPPKAPWSLRVPVTSLYSGAGFPLFIQGDIDERCRLSVETNNGFISSNARKLYCSITFHESPITIEILLSPVNERLLKKILF